MSSNIVSDKLFTPKNIEVRAFGATGSIVSKENNFFVDILSKSSRENQKSNRTSEIKETNNHVVETEVAGDQEITENVNVSNDYDGGGQENLAIELVVPFIGCANIISCNDNGDLSEVQVHPDTGFHVMMRENEEITEDSVIEEKDANILPTNNILSNITLFENQQIKPESVALIADINISNIEDGASNIEVLPKLEISALDIEQEFLTNGNIAIKAEQNSGQPLEIAYDFSTKTGNITDSQVQATIKIEVPSVNISKQNGQLNLGEQIKIDQQLQPDIAISKTMPINIQVSKGDQKDVTLINTAIGDDNEIMPTLPINVISKNLETIKGMISFQPIRIQDIAKNITKKDEQILLNQSLDFTQPLITQNGDQLLVSYKDVQSQQDLKAPHLEQVVVAVRSAISQGKGQIILSMYPENLGVVDVRIEFNDLKEVSSIKIYAEKQETLQLLQRDSENLLDSLKIVIKSDDASLSFNLRDGQNEQARYEEQEGNNNSSGIEEDTTKASAEEGRGQSSIVNNTDIDITI
jgi:hypothetical protein